MCFERVARPRAAFCLGHIEERGLSLLMGVNASNAPFLHVDGPEASSYLADVAWSGQFWDQGSPYFDATPSGGRYRPLILRRQGVSGLGCRLVRHAWTCQHPEGCSRAAFLTPSKKLGDVKAVSKFCREHCEAELGTIDLRKRRWCQFVGCRRQASYADVDTASNPHKPSWCSKHAGEDCINVVSARWVGILNAPRLFIRIHASCDPISVCVHRISSQQTTDHVVYVSTRPDAHKWDV